MPKPTSRSAAAAFACVEVRVGDRALAERVAAEAFDAGAVGAEEREQTGRIALLLYAPAGAAARVVRRVRALGAAPEIEVAPARAVPEVDWSEAWKADLGPTEISPRLRVRPSFAGDPPAAGQAELVIDPGQAFGTGAHESTRLALEWIDALAPALAPGARVLDVGTGSGVLALAALRLGAARAVALDLDPLAAPEARANARRNGLGARLTLFTGPLAALRAAPFDLVLANLLRRELAPLAPALARSTRRGGRLIASGLLAAERAEAEALLVTAGLRTLGARERDDASGERWTALLTSR